MRAIVVAGLAALVIAGGVTAAVWQAGAGGSSHAGGGSIDWNFPVTDQISCSSAQSCLAVGASIRGRPGTSVPVAQAFDAGTWRTVAVKSPGLPGKPSTLTGVSCPTARYCLAVGAYNTSPYGNSLPYAMAWNGRSLSLIARPPLLDSNYVDGINGVSCPAVNRCVVLGHSDAGELLWTWNGTTWSVATRDTAGTDDLSSIQCVTVTNCLTAGQELDTVTVPAVDRWDGTNLTSLNPPVPAEMTYASFSGLSCVARDRCVAVGLGYGADKSPIVSFLDVWNGRTWKLTIWHGPHGARDAELSAVSCSAASDCVAVGSDGPDADQQAAALTWNGSTWTADAVPGPGPGKTSIFYGVNCSKTGGCTAIGEEGQAGVTVDKLTNASPIAGRWNGSAWQETAA